MHEWDLVRLFSIPLKKMVVSHAIKNSKNCIQIKPLSIAVLLLFALYHYKWYNIFALINNPYKYMQSKQIRTPIFINICFLFLVFVPPIAIYSMTPSCTDIYYADQMWPVELKDYPHCEKKFQYLTRMRIKQFLNHQK